MEIKNISGKNVVYLEGEVNAQSGAEIKKRVLDLFSTGNAAVVLSFIGVFAFVRVYDLEKADSLP